MKKYLKFSIPLLILTFSFVPNLAKGAVCIGGDVIACQITAQKQQDNPELLIKNQLGVSIRSIVNNDIYKSINTDSSVNNICGPTPIDPFPYFTSSDLRTWISCANKMIDKVNTENKIRAMELTLSNANITPESSQQCGSTPVKAEGIVHLDGTSDSYDKFSDDANVWINCENKVMDIVNILKIKNKVLNNLYPNDATSSVVIKQNISIPSENNKTINKNVNNKGILKKGESGTFKNEALKNSASTSINIVANTSYKPSLIKKISIFLVSFISIFGF